MRILAFIMVIILLLVGFSFYSFISDEVEEAQVSQINTIDTQAETVLVDKLDDLDTYTHRVSTYEQPSSDLVKAASNYLNEVSENHIHIFYFKDNNLVHEEYSSETIELGDLKKELIVVYQSEPLLESNLEASDMTIYSVEGLYMVHISPKQTGRYQLSSGDNFITFENLERK